MHKYFPQTKDNIKDMLKVIGATSIDDLFQSIPSRLRYKTSYDLPSFMGDDTLTRHMQEKANENQVLTVFRGGGAFDHYVPSVVKTIVSRQEFLTSYTPYQPEVAQGTLQYIFEFQSMVTSLTGMDVANASMYDGATATAEAMFMAYGLTQKNTILVSSTVSKPIVDVIETYGKYRNINVLMVPEKDGHIDTSSLQDLMTDTMGLIAQNPNKYGVIENYEGVSDLLHQHHALFILNMEGMALPLLKTPQRWHADIACGDMQSFGIPMSMGGAYLGYLATKHAYVRKMPGRLCGLTTDVDGKRAFVLTLQAREQHIRRAKANSNICSNQSLNALAATVYTSLLGQEGLVEVAQNSINGAYHLKQMLLDTKLFSDPFLKPTYKEFTLKTSLSPETLEQKLLDHGILGPIHHGDGLVTFAVTEKRTLKDMKRLIEAVLS
jgi:glycine dehydrogenase subunit 1